MPPLKGIDRGLNGEALKALEEAGHGQVIAIVDPSYAIPEGAPVIDYQGDSSTDALKGILALVPNDKTNELYDVVAMNPDDDKAGEATQAFQEIAAEMHLQIGFQKRLDTSSGLDHSPGFYTDTNKPDALFVRTRDRRAYACARFVVGHSQE